MKIAITGAQGVGKTTLTKQISEEFPDFKILPEAARLAKEAGYNLDQNSTIESERWLIAKQIELEKTEGNWVADRSTLDLLAYIHHLFPNEKDLLEFAVKTLVSKFNNYDLVLYLPSGQFAIENDGIRNTDPEFQQEIDKKIKNILGKYQVSFIEITGSPQERLEKVKKLIKKSF